MIIYMKCCFIITFLIIDFFLKCTSRNSFGSKYFFTYHYLTVAIFYQSACYLSKIYWALVPGFVVFPFFFKKDSRKMIKGIGDYQYV